MKGQITTLYGKPSFSFVGVGRGLLARIARWHQLYRQRRELASLSDATLEDLGLSRADILRESERPFWDDPLRK
ncbi:DUF1127 domain-containing protein [Pseudomonas guariconensis]|uniref:DUF1127 domain-containing protein n=1 Tax=Pseudomonas TaxID=286 RepID=UPI001CE3DD42|nr:MULTISPECIES: DUF1127 domain-containing protein [Pseudomonas]MCO7643453.1 DUF1127 domain-containing protein [Pseudomonas sp. S 311-6]MCO7514926.1 DUF1127 domain-containing protein [Pseudomonas putida]MCO7568047.1 DUF1127 domain-containing protein [Pseudomonas mosselii]MCO7594019.1 DUF1127 domain-containing protein [Pseudomonas guariconensis]MCO7608272.1 DUF1127 domain-containing protein [Pseudomonas guariconensis]